jgi:Na+/H+-dicarboxylate symporter
VKKKSKAWLWILIGMILGLVVGLILPKNSEFTNHVLPWIALPGNIFLAVLQMIMIPLVVASVALGVASQGGNRDLGKLSFVSIVYFAGTTAIAITIGIVLSVSIKPGNYVDSNLVISELEKSRREAGIESNSKPGSQELGNKNRSNGKSIQKIEEKVEEANMGKRLPTLILNVFPKNPLQSLMEANMLSVVVFALMLGIALTQVPAGKEKPLVDLLDSIQEYTMVVVNWALAIAPIAVFGLMAQAISQIGWDLLTGLTVYIGTVLLGLFCVLILYLFLGYFVGKMNPFIFIARMKELQILAFSSSSSAAVLPVSLKTAIEGLHVRPKIADFVIPLGATINMNGTAIYQGIATVFLAQIFGVELGLSQLLALVVTVVGASIGTAATPGVGIVILAGILTSFGIPVEGIAILFGVDRFLDMCRTAINVTGDVVAAKIIDRLLREKV